MKAKIIKIIVFRNITIQLGFSFIFVSIYSVIFLFVAFFSGVDTQMKFTLNPMPGEAGFAQWKDAMKALARLPNGVPKEFRKSVSTRVV